MYCSLRFVPNSSNSLDALEYFVWFGPGDNIIVNLIYIFCRFSNPLKSHHYWKQDLASCFAQVENTSELGINMCVRTYQDRVI